MPDHPSLNVALRAVESASAVARQVQQNLARVREITKDDRSPVTVADFAVQAIVNRTLADNDSNVRIVGEEDADALRANDAAAVRGEVVRAVQTVHAGLDEDAVLDAIDLGNHDGGGNLYWTLDPVDGTKGFLRGQQYAIALGLIENGEVVLGVMGCPNLPLDHDALLDRADPHGSMYAAAKGSGATEYRRGPGNASSTAAIDLSGGTGGGGPGTGSIRVCESVESAHSNQSDSARIIDAMGSSSQPVRLDSQCKYAVVARDQADAYLRLPTRPGYVEKIWDHAAGSLIATEAGAVVTDVSGNKLDFSHGKRLEQNRGVICAHPDVHGRIIQTIAQLGIGAPA